jgi:hypothetical protein
LAQIIYNVLNIEIDIAIDIEKVIFAIVKK